MWPNSVHISPKYFRDITQNKLQGGNEYLGFHGDIIFGEQFWAGDTAPSALPALLWHISAYVTCHLHNLVIKCLNSSLYKYLLKIFKVSQIHFNDLLIQVSRINTINHLKSVL